MENTGSTTVNVATEAVKFLDDVILPVGTNLLEWVVSTPGMREFFFMLIIGAIVGLFNRIRHSFS